MAVAAIAFLKWTVPVSYVGTVGGKRSFLPLRIGFTRFQQRCFAEDLGRLLDDQERSQNIPLLSMLQL